MSFHDGSKAKSGAHVVSEDQEGGAVRDQATHGHSVHDGAHRVLADAKVKILGSVVSFPEITLSLHIGLGRRSEIRCAPDQKRQAGGNRVEYLFRSRARRNGFLIRVEDGDLLFPAIGQLAAHEPVPLSAEVRILAPINSQFLLPISFGSLTARNRLAIVRQSLLRNIERRRYRPP